MIYFFIFLDITHGAFQKWDKMSFYPYYYSVELIFSELLCNWRGNKEGLFSFGILAHKGNRAFL